MKEKIHKTTLFDRFKNAIKAFKGEPIESIRYGVNITRCDKCEEKWKSELIDWLMGHKYISIDEHDTEMTEEFEQRYRWELSRNCFINKAIDYIMKME